MNLLKLFLIPFIPFIETDSSLFRLDPFREEPPTVSAFNEESFLKGLNGVGHFRHMKQDKLVRLYKKFMTGPHFTAWLQQSQRDALEQALVDQASHIVSLDKLPVMTREETASAAAVVRGLSMSLANNPQWESIRSQLDKVQLELKAEFLLSMPINKNS